MFTETLPYHSNGLTFLAVLENGQNIAETYYSIGGGFVKKKGRKLLATHRLACLSLLMMPMIC
ncbi:hypothetical protein KRR40_05850 [Niabella defluvii]|nr:hypothetical protein KRR40_05850 [Niabella sp. I65]